MLFVKRYKIRSYEAGLLFRDKEFQGIREAGTYWFLDPLNKVRLEIVSKRDPWLVHEKLDLIVKSGIANAINSQLGGLKHNKEAVAEAIENNVRSKIVKEHLSDPAFYEAMSALLDEIIQARKSKALEYEAYLKLIAELAMRVQAGHVDEMPKTLDTPGKRALYNNLGHDEALALRVDETVKRMRPDGWRDVQAREQVIKAALYGVLQDIAEVKRIFLKSADRVLMVMQLKLGDVAVDVVLKDIKNIHLSVHPPTGSVRISAPLRTNLEPLRLGEAISVKGG